MSGEVINKKVLVTGGAGFIGSNLCEKLIKQGNQVICLDNFITGRKENISQLIDASGFTVVEGDIRDSLVCKEAVKGVEIVFHQAALGSVPRSVKDPVTTHDINVNGFVNVLEASRQEGIKRFVYASSSSVYGNDKHFPKQEEFTGRPLSPYAVSKKITEYYAGVYADLYGMEIIGLRYFNVFGRKQDPNGPYAAAIPRFIEALISHESPVIHDDGMQTRDFTYVDNVLQANELAATTTSPGAINQVYNIAYGQSTTINILIEMLQELLSEFDPAIKNVQPVFGPERVGDIKFSLASVEKAKKLLGYAPGHDLKKGLEEAVEWYWETFSKQE